MYDYRKCFCNFSVQEIKRTGIMTRIEDTVWPPKYKEIVEDPPTSVTFETVTIFFIVLLTGVATSVFVLVVEFGLQKLGQSFQWLPF
jgi:hypothetical protein